MFSGIRISYQKLYDKELTLLHSSVSLFIPIPLSLIFQYNQKTNQQIVNEKGANMGPNEMGQLFIKYNNKNKIQGYYSNKKANEESFDNDFWFNTGDLAMIDEDAFVTITERKKNVISVGFTDVGPFSCLFISFLMNWRFSFEISHFNRSFLWTLKKSLRRLEVLKRWLS